MLHRPLIQHCKSCGTAVTYRLPDDGDTRERAVCPSCQTIHYENPLNVVGTVPVWGNKVLLCKRNIEPRLGKWTLPQVSWSWAKPWPKVQHAKPPKKQARSSSCKSCSA